MLIDDVTITVKAGDGGNGVVHFKRNAQTAKGGPDGGNGGNGGNLYFQGINDISGLQQFQYKKNIAAENGVKGGRQNLFGRNGKDITIRIPMGTLVRDVDTNQIWEIADETTANPGETTKFLIAKGGKGGRGNNEFKTPTDQAPYYAEKGQEGQQRTLRLILRIIADIGLIGLPNAGKSSLLKTLTNAKPKIGDYPFTTLEPNLGVMFNHVTANHPKKREVGGESVEKEMGSWKEYLTSHIKIQPPTSNFSPQIILADIPGLIEGASSGKGLGIKFLKHVEKTNLLIHCIDSTDSDLLKIYTIVRKELESFSSTLAEKKEIILLTKTDLTNPKELEKKKNDLKKTGREVLKVSIYNEKELEHLKNFLLTHIK